MAQTNGHRGAQRCAHCGAAVHIDIVERVAVEHLAGQELPPVLRFESYCANQVCWAYRRPQVTPHRR